jgi:putative toxin-antitoxin system antitoxin component (TIGR02293 family)
MRQLAEIMARAEPTIEDVAINRTVELLGGRRTLHRPVRNRPEAHDLLQKGLPGHALRHLVNDVAMLRAPHHGSLEKAVGISLRTYQRRKGAPDKKLSPVQSGRAWKFAEILGRAIELFDGQNEPARTIADSQAEAPARRRSAPAVVRCLWHPDQHATLESRGVPEHFS